jgi:taurine dioxygenase
MEGFSWRALEPFGAEIEFDLRQPLTGDGAAAFRALFYTHELLLVRGQALSLEQQQAVAGYIGPVLSGGRGLEYISPDDAVLGDSAMTFHSDLSFAPEPFRALSLHALDVAENRTSTRFVSGVRAYRRLPAELKARIAQLEAVSLSTRSVAKREAGYDIPPNSTIQVRKMVMTHPVTGVPILYINESHTARAEGLSRAESDALLEELFAYLYAPENRLEHTWRNGDLLLWDNLALQHGRPDVRGVWPRRLQRAAVSERSMAEQIPEYVAALGQPAAVR